MVHSTPFCSYEKCPGGTLSGAMNKQRKKATNPYPELMNAHVILPSNTFFEINLNGCGNCLANVAKSLTGVQGDIEQTECLKVFPIGFECSVHFFKSTIGC